jgi:hypothetical protein
MRARSLLTDREGVEAAHVFAGGLVKFAAKGGALSGL